MGEILSSLSVLHGIGPPSLEFLQGIASPVRSEHKPAGATGQLARAGALHSGQRLRRGPRGAAVRAAALSLLLLQGIPPFPSTVTREYPHSLLLLQGNTLIPFYCYKGIPSIPFNITREYPYSLLKVQGDGASGFPWRARYDTIAGAGGHRGKTKGVDASAVVDLSEPAQALEPGF